MLLPIGERRLLACSEEQLALRISICAQSAGDPKDVLGKLPSAAG
jgi:hypothetical protein